MSEKYSVSLSIIGTAIIEVEARNEREAISAAIENIDFEHIDTWDVVRSQGHCSKDAEVELIELPS